MEEMLFKFFLAIILADETFFDGVHLEGPEGCLSYIIEYFVCSLE